MKMNIVRMAILACSWSGCVSASQLITNGGFETGTLSSWTVSTEAGSYPGSNFFASKATTAPQSGVTTVGPDSGTYYALSDTADVAALVLSQAIVVPANASSVILSYDLFVDSGSPGAVNTTNNLDFNQVSSQFGIVSLLSSGTSLFSTGAGDLMNFYEGVDPNLGSANPYTAYSFNITPLVASGGTYILRFGAVNNVDTLNLGVDNVSVVFTAASAPEPSTILLTLLGIGGAALLRSRRWLVNPLSD